MRVIIHVGMHKTGTSSIQDAFAKVDDPNLHYIKWSSGNHSALFVLLFQDIDKLAEYHSFKARGKSFIDGLPALRKHWRENLENQLSQATGKTVIFSAEDISTPHFGNATKRLYEFFKKWTDDISVVGYARNPQTFFGSIFQQYLKGDNVKSLNFDFLRPHYRARFENIDRFFGEDRVLLKDFSSHRLLNDDVVQDFAESIGIAVPPEHLFSRANESLSLEATALLYVQRKYGVGFKTGFSGAHAANDQFISKLRTIGTQKLSFSGSLIQPILTKIHDDVSWMEARMGTGFSEAKNDSKSAISSEADLVDVALQNLAEVQKLTGEKPKSNSRSDMENLVDALELLREQCCESVGVNAGGEIRKSSNIKAQTGKKDRTMTNESGVEEISELDLLVRRKLAYAMWHADNRGEIPEDTDERKIAYKKVAQDYRRKAATVIRRLKSQHISLVLDEEYV